jgi:cytochrome c-type biogenesis protein
VPGVLGAAASEHRWGCAALAAGLAVAFVAIGLFAATVGYSIELDAELFRNIAAALMITVGVVLLVPRFQELLALGRWRRRIRRGHIGGGVGGGGFAAGHIGGGFVGRSRSRPCDHYFVLVCNK